MSQQAVTPYLHYKRSTRRDKTRTLIILNEATMRAREDVVDSNESVLIVSRLVQCSHGAHDTSTIRETSAATLEITNCNA